MYSQMNVQMAQVRQAELVAAGERSRQTASLREARRGGRSWLSGVLRIPALRLRRPSMPASRTSAVHS
jgi:hypothetical protein